MNIYLSTETNYENNGLGFLTDIKEAKVIDMVNGEYSLTFSYPIKGALSEYIVEENVVKCKVADGTYQPFRIKRVEKTFTDYTVYALHIFYDLADNFVTNTSPTNLNPQAFLQWVFDRANFTCTFTPISSIATTKSANYIRKNLAEVIIGEQDNSMINKFGLEIKRDNKNIHLLTRLGADNGVKLIAGKNITGIKITTDITNLYTRIMPLGYDGITIPNTYVDSPLINNYPTPKICKYEFSNIKYDPSEPEAYTTLEEAQAALIAATNELYANGIDKPKVNIKIDWLELSKTKEYYEKYANLERVNIGDTITAEVLGLWLETRVIKTKYNVLSDTIESFEIGTANASFTNSVNQIAAEVEEVNPSSILTQARQSATNLINAAMGGYVYKTQSELYIMDTDDPATATNVWRWNLNGLGYSSTGINGEYGLAMTMDGSIVADFIKTGTLNTNLIEGYDSLTTSVSTLKNGYYQYTITPDITYQASKSYYRKDEDDYVLLIVGTDYNVGDTIPQNQIYEREFITGVDGLREQIGTIERTITTQTNTAIETWFTQSGVQGTLNDLKERLTTSEGAIEGYKSYIRQGVDDQIAITTDTTYQPNKRYYKLQSGVYVKLIEGTDYQVGQTITGTKYESLHYGDTYIELGAATNTTTIKIYPNEVVFYTSGNRTAYISDNALYIEESTILKKEVIGHWQTEEDNLGNLNTKWVGV